jgi:hypothetical protein
MDLTEKYVLLQATSHTGTFDLDDLEEPEGIKSFELHQSAPLLARWGVGATGTLRDGNRKKPAIADCVLNTNRLLVISARLRAALEALGVTDVEYLPITLTLEGRPIGLSYFILHCIHWEPCLDLKASKVTWSEWSDDIDELERLVFARDPDKKLFQIEKYSEIILLRMDVAEALSTKQAFSGVRYVPLFCHPEFDLSKRETPLWKRIDALYTPHVKAKAQPIGASPPPKRKRASASEVKAWLAKAPEDGVVTTPTMRSQYRAGADDSWLDAFEDDPDSWAGFDPKRYRAFGFDGQGNHFLLDLEADGAVVFYSHETGYRESALTVLAPSMAAFRALVK